MIPEVTSVEVVGGRRLRLGFDDGVVGDVDVGEIVPFEGVFAELVAGGLRRGATGSRGRDGGVAGWCRSRPARALLEHHRNPG